MPEILVGTITPFIYLINDWMYFGLFTTGKTVRLAIFLENKHEAQYQQGDREEKPTWFNGEPGTRPGRVGLRQSIQPGNSIDKRFS